MLPKSLRGNSQGISLTELSRLVGETTFCFEFLKPAVSRWPGEKEVLFSPNSRFAIRERYAKQDGEALVKNSVMPCLKHTPLSRKNSDEL